MRTALAISFSVGLFSAACGPAAKPRFEGNPEWVGRASGVFPAPKGAGKIEGIAAGSSVARADTAACAESTRILARRLAAALPATDDASTIPPLKAADQRVISRWQGPEGTSWSLCVMDKASVRQTLNATQMPPALRDYLLVEVDKILSK